MPKNKRPEKPSPSKPPKARPKILPPQGLTQEQADALPIPDEIPPALGDALTQIIKRLAPAKGEDDDQPDSSHPKGQ
jgi:hypothetical protein